jgi:hypothetical protein
MDQQALLAGLVQLNAGLSNNLVLVEYLPGAPQGTIQHHARHAIASPPCFSMPGLTLQGFNGTPAHTASLLPNAPLPPLLGSNQAASQLPTLVRPVESVLSALAPLPPRSLLRPVVMVTCACCASVNSHPILRPPSPITA